MEEMERGMEYTGLVVSGIGAEVAGFGDATDETAITGPGVADVVADVVLFCL